MWCKSGVNYGGTGSEQRMRIDMAKTPKTGVSIVASNGRLQLRYWWQDERKYLSLGISDNQQNRYYAEVQAERMRSDLITGNFDESLERYRPKQEPKPVKLEPAKLAIGEIWDRYTDYKSKHVAQSTAHKDFGRVDRKIAQVWTTPYDRAIEIRDYLNRECSPDTAKRILTQLGAACTWASKSGLISGNPFAGMAKDIKKAKGKTGQDINPFTATERDRIVSFFYEADPAYAHYVEFLFRTGCRPSEAIALQWKHVSDDCETITFRQSATESSMGIRIKEGLKTQSRRVFPCGQKLADFLANIKPVEIEELAEARDLEGLVTAKNQLVFPAPGGGCINIQNFSRRHWKPCLYRLGIEHRPPYNTRHTFITFCIEQGMAPQNVAELVGNSAEVILSHYAGIKRDLIAPDF